jgi:YVTN family beta-propeller protein
VIRRLRYLAVWLTLVAAAAFACDDLSVRAPATDPPASEAARAKPPPTFAPTAPGHLRLQVEREEVRVCERPLGLLLSPADDTLYVACAGSGRVTALDTDSLQPRWTSQPLFERIYKLAYDDRRRQVYAVGMNGRFVHVLDAAGETVAQINVGGNIADMALAPDVDRLVVTIAQPPQAALIDVNTLRIDGYVVFPTPPGSLTIRRDGQLAVASSGLWQVKGKDFTPVQQPVYLFDPRQAGRTLDSLGLGGAQARHTLFTHGGANLLVAERTADSVAVFDVASRRLLRTIPVGAAPEKMVASPDGAWAFTLDSKGASITRVDLRAREADGYAVLPADPEDLAIAADGRELYAALAGAEGRRGAVAVVDASDMTVADAIPVGRDPCSLVSSADGARVYVSNFLSDSVSVLE